MNIFKQAAGNLVGLLATRPFLVGEIFIQTLTDANNNNFVDVSDKNIYDVVTKAKINQLYKGDIYGGAGYGTRTGTTDTDNKCWVYQLGSGNSLKFGSRLLYTWDDLTKKEVKDHPNTVYLYVGEKTGTMSDQYKVGNFDDPKFEGTDKVKVTDVEDAIGDAGRYNEKHDLQDVLDAGDFVFWHPVYKYPGQAAAEQGMFFYWHNSRTVDSLVRLSATRMTSVSALVELDNLNKKAIDEAASSTSYSKDDQKLKAHSDSASLLDYINGPMRLNQSLIDTKGWEAFTFSCPEVANGRAVTYTNADGTPVTIYNPSTHLKYANDKDGAIHYVPFIAHWKDSIGVDYSKRLGYNSTDVFSVEFANDTITGLRPGDIVISVPDFKNAINTSTTEGANKLVRMYREAHPDKFARTDEGAEVADTVLADALNWAHESGVSLYGTKHVVISLYADYLQQLDASRIEIQRADTYADNRWAVEDGQLQDAAEHMGSEVSVKDFIENLYKTKVDIDPVTGKVITSQLPEFLLGAMKYLGTIAEDPTAKAEEKEVYTLRRGIEIRKTVTKYFVTLETGAKVEVFPEADGMTWSNEDGIPYGEDDVTEEESFTTITLDEYLALDSVAAKEYSFVKVNDGTVVTFKKATNVTMVADTDAALSHSETVAILSNDYLTSTASGTPAQKLVWEIINKANNSSIQGSTTGTTTDDSDPNAGENYDQRTDSDKDVNGDVDKNGTFDEWDAAACKGYYFIWSGCKLDLDDPENEKYQDFFSGMGQTDEVDDENEGRATSINPGDFLVFNGEDFDIVDNSDSLVGIQVWTNTGANVMLDGVPLFTGDSDISKATETYSVTADNTRTNFAGSRINRIDYNVTKQTNGELQIVAPGQVVFKVLTNNDEALSKTGAQYKQTIEATSIPLVSNEGIIHDSRFAFMDATTVDNVVRELSVLKYNDSKYGTKLNFNKDDESLQYVFGFSGAGSNGSSLYMHYFLENGLGQKTSGTAPNLTYSDTFSIGGSATTFVHLDIKATNEESTLPDLRLPDYSGTLTTEAYVNTGFGIIEALLDEMYRTVTAGTEDYLQTVRVVTMSDGTKQKKIVDSYVQQKRIDETTTEAGAVKLIFKSYDKKETETVNDHDPRVAGILTSKTAISYPMDGDTTLRPKWHERLTTTVGDAASPDREAVVGVPVKGDARAENILPAHGGILLNTDSIIDCGFWDAKGVAGSVNQNETCYVADTVADVGGD